MNATENVRLTGVTPGSPMSELFKRYWIPAGLSSDLPDNDGDPIRVRLLGEDFVAFRNSEGEVGILDELCPHRRASLMLGQVRQGGIECIYHGWRFATDGSILEMPNCSDSALRKRYGAKSYPVVEAGGLMWVYLGDRKRMPAFVRHEWMTVPDKNRHPRIIASRSNFVQVMEGLLDTTHATILHQDTLPKADGTVRYVNNTVRPKERFIGAVAAKDVPRVEVQETDYGLHAAALRRVDIQGQPRLDIRITAFVAPFTIFIANGKVVLMAVPVDTETTYLYDIYWDLKRPFAEEPYRSDIERGTGTQDEIADRWGFSRKTFGHPDMMSARNRWGQNRSVMRNGESYSGLAPFSMEDAACTSSMGPVSDRDEMLVPADLAIVRMRRYMLKAADAVASGGDPPGFSDPAFAATVGAIYATSEPDTEWKSLLPESQAA
ncbi:MAG TPA: Rieske 2Fe-2S domain-containing protein [Burkholderiaceae bacterium]|nr:Rieske 2Fe-2S domain-containing protein [Burkholderiaceae bacterium]